MHENVNAKELFGKDTPDNLSEKSLKKAAKKKKDLIEVVESNIPFMVEYYFGKSDHKWIEYIHRLVGSKYFLKPLKALLKDQKKNKTTLPKGLHVIMIDSVDKVRELFNKKIGQYQNQNGNQSHSDLNSDFIQQLKEKCNEQESAIMKIASSMVKKERKAFEGLGIEEQYASKLALACVPKKYLNEHNIGKYIHRLNNTLMLVMNAGLEKDVNENGEERFINHIGVNLASLEVLAAIYGIFLHGVSRKVYLKALVSVLLERRSKANQYFNKPQKSMYNNISNLILQILEGEIVINTSGKKMDKKDLKEAKISKKELRKIMAHYSKERLRDMSKNNDSTRRIIFSSLAEDMYPNILKVFRQSQSDAVTEDFEGSIGDLRQPDEDNKKNQQNRNNNQNNNNRNKNRDRIQF